MSLPRPPIKRRQLALANAAADDDDHDDHARNGTQNGIQNANANGNGIEMGWDGIAMKRAMSELGVWHIKRWHRTGSQHMLDI